MADPIDLNEYRPMAEMFSLTIYRRQDGSLFAGVTDANTDWIDSTAEMTVAERFRHMADLCDNLRPSLEECAADLELPSEGGQ